MVSRKKKTTSTKRRKAKPAKLAKTKRKTRSGAKVKVVHPAERQLSVYHDPFSIATKQPKIPDGKMTESLGLSSQRVGEFTVANGTSVGAVDNSGVMHILLFGGRNCGMLVSGHYQGQFAGSNPAGTAFTDAKSRNYAVGFNSMNDWSGSLLDASGVGTLSMLDPYAYWRVVSSGVVLSLLNPAEEDDGWWEAVRLQESRDATGYGTQAPDAGNTSGQLAVVPSQILEETKTEVLSNQNSYCTGLLRDLKNHVFKLHPVKDDHDVIHTTNEIRSLNAYYDTYGAPTTVRGSHNAFTLNADNYDVGELIRSSVDTSLDMIYIRIYGRTSGNPTRLHYNVVTNQEAAFENDRRESRYHTVGHTVKNIGEHIGAKKMNNSAAHIIGM